MVTELTVLVRLETFIRDAFIKKEDVVAVFFSMWKKRHDNKHFRYNGEIQNRLFCRVYKTSSNKRPVIAGSCIFFAT